MKKQLFLRLSTLALAATFFTACSSSESSKSNGNGGLKAQSLRKEKVTCNSSSVTSEQYQSNAPQRFLDETVTIAERQVSADANGNEYAETTGEVTSNYYQLFDSSSKVFESKISYTYVAKRKSQKTILPDGTVKVVAQIQNTQTGKDGYEFSDGRGGKTKVRTSEYTTEIISRIEGNKTVDISFKKDGQDQPLYNYATYSSTSNGIQSERTILESPYTIDRGDSKTTVESEEDICRIESI